MPEEAPYKQSRAALRARYGSRAIDASAPYSAQDTTPSARMAKLKERGYDETTAKRKDKAEWGAQFEKKYPDGQTPIAQVIPGPVPVPKQETDPLLNLPNSVASTPDFDPLDTPFARKPFSLIPDSLGDPASMLEFLPSPDPTISQTPVFAPRKKAYGSSIFGGSTLFGNA